MMTTRPRQLRARRGAILILVIVLLVLMAMMGIAYMATARVDRVGASTNVVNTQIDLLVEGARNMAQGLIVNDLFGDGGAYRPPRVQGTAAGYDHWDAPHNDADPWLASRVPVPLSELAQPFDSAPTRIYSQGELVVEGGRFYMCRADQTGSIAGPPNPEWVPLTEPDGTPMAGSRPVWPYLTRVSEAQAFRFENVIFQAGAAWGGSHNVRQLAFPAVVNVNGQAMAGIRMFNPADGQLYDYLGADADGDGIADSLLFPMTLSEQDGVRYYAAIRIIDHNSALNVLTALQPQGGNRNHFFPSNIDLVGMLGVDPGTYAAGVFNIDPGDFRNPPGRTDFEFQTLAEALWMVVGRRLEVAQLQSSLPPQTDGALLAHRFVLSPRSGQASMFDAFAADRTEPYDVASDADVDEWLSHFDYNAEGGAAFHRPLLVTSNAVSNAIAARSITERPGPRGSQPRSWAHQLTEMADYDPHPVKVSINTAEFGELWLAFWATMVENAATSSPPSWINADDQAVTVPMFREVQRWQPEPEDEEGDDGDDGDDGTPRFQPTPDNFRVLLRSALAAVNAIDLRDPDQDITVREFTIGDWQFTVYGMEMQPFITEVVVYRAADANTEDDYVAIEIFNPHSEAIDLTGWKLATVDRTLPQVDGQPDRAQPLVLAEVADLASRGAAQIEPGQFLVLQSRESEDIDPVDGQPIEIPELYDVRGKELILLRPRMLGADDEPLDQMVPIDQFDFTELHEENAGNLEQPPQWYYYSRPTDNWEWVFPGRYTAHSDPDKVLDPIIPDGYIALRYEDLEEQIGPPGGASLGVHNTDVTVTLRYQIQLNQPGWPGERGEYPFGGFARNGDILKVPFIGAYMVRDRAMPAGQFWELNSVVMDAALADDPDRDQQAVGRFAPYFDPTIDDPEHDSYAWAADLLDYLTVQAPQDDYLPEADPATYMPTPQPVFSSPASEFANDRRQENLVGVQGLININTAPWRVLATLPFVPNDTQDSNNNGAPDKAEAIAKAIVADRRAHGPYRTLFDLMRVPEFREPAGLAADALWGDFDEADDPADDFERRYLMLTRISNLVTTRSDTFTVYVLVQGWRGSKTPNPVLAAERRAAFIIDRNPVQQWDQAVILRSIPQE